MKKTMKKTYMYPMTWVCEMEPESVMATSGVTSGNGIGYGGVDTNGTETPDAKEESFDFNWEE